MTSESGPQVPVDEGLRRRSLASWTAVSAIVLALAGCGDDNGGSRKASTSGGSTDGGTEPTIVDVTPDPPPDPRGLLPSLAVANQGFESDHYSGSAQCSQCHNNDEMTVTTESGPKDVSIGTAWETSVMANSTRDPYWHAVVAYELDRFPMQEEEINDKCTRCHAPMMNDYVKKEGLPMPSLFDKGSEADGDFVPGLLSMAAGDTMFDHAMDGVSCTLCHQMDPENLGLDSSLPEEAQTGGWQVLDYRGTTIEDRPAYAQYSDPDGGYMQSQVGFLAQLGEHMSRSETCGTCHNLNIKPIDKNGEPVADAGHFAEQANYTEWLFSDYRKGGPLEKSCMDCHMPTLDQPVVLGEGSGLDKRDGFREHTFLGANTVMQSMLRDFSAELGVAPELDFDESIERNREFLTTSASVAIANGVISSEGDVDTLDFDVQITNETGHKLPSGYHSRRVYLHVLVSDSDGEVVFESGRMNEDGSIVGVAEDVNPAVWEPHHDVITSERDVQVYQAIVGNSDEERTHSLLNGSYYLKDNRLTPKGFNKRDVTGSPGVAASFGVFGKAMEDDDFDSGLDTVSYRVTVPAMETFSVRAELRYQPFSYGHLRDLFLASDRIDQVDQFRTIYDATTLRDEIIDTATSTIN